MIRHPPKKVPNAIAAAEARTTETGTTKFFESNTPAEISRAVITPIVF